MNVCHSRFKTRKTKAMPRRKREGKDIFRGLLRPFSFLLLPALLLNCDPIGEKKRAFPEWIRGEWIDTKAKSGGKGYGGIFTETTLTAYYPSKMTYDLNKPGGPFNTAFDRLSDDEVWFSYGPFPSARFRVKYKRSDDGSISLYHSKGDPKDFKEITKLIKKT